MDTIEALSAPKRRSPMTPLEPCPFCGTGSPDIQTGTPDREGTPTNRICVACGATGPWCYEREGEHQCSDNLWNTRLAAVPVESLKDWFLKTEKAGYFDDWPAYLVQQIRHLIVKAERQE
jgi:hypothetical protein